MRVLSSEDCFEARRPANRSSERRGVLPSSFRAAPCRKKWTTDFTDDTNVARLRIRSSSHPVTDPLRSAPSVKIRFSFSLSFITQTPLRSPNI